MGPNFFVFLGNEAIEVIANKQSGFVGVLCIVLRFQRFPKLTEVVDIADLGLDIVGACAEDSSEPLSDAFSKVVLLCTTRIRVRTRMHRKSCSQIDTK